MRAAKDLVIIVKPLGGEKSLIQFPSVEIEGKSLDVTKAWLERWFEATYEWSYREASLIGRVWIYVEGVPLHAWNENHSAVIFLSPCANFRACDQVSAVAMGDSGHRWVSFCRDGRCSVVQILKFNGKPVFATKDILEFHLEHCLKTPIHKLQI
ncbi:hypothetical protein U1Q18_040908 [Sarracenia purpurea var. burkii]